MTFFPKENRRRAALFALGLGAASPWSQTVHTEADKRTFVHLLPTGWNMQTNDRLDRYYLPQSVFPDKLTTDKILSTHVQIRSDPGTDGRSLRTNSIYRLSPTSGTGDGLWGGQFHIQCDNLPQCEVTIDRGFSMISHFAQSGHAHPTFPRAYLKFDYLWANTTPPSGAVQANDYYFRIGPWGMQTAQGANQNRPISLPGMNTNQIVQVSATVHSNPDNGGKIEVNNFERRGYKNKIETGDLTLRRGGYIETETGAPPKARLYIHGKRAESLGHDAILFNDGRYTETAANRGWVKVTYAGSANIAQPFIVKSKIASFDNWPITYEDPTPNRDNRIPQPVREIDLATFGVAANRIVHAEGMIISDPKDSFGRRSLTNLMRTNLTTMNQGSAEDGAFRIDEASGKILMAASGTSPAQLYYWDHERTDVTRGWFTVDYLAGECTAGGSGYTLRAIGLSTKSGACAGSGNLVLQGSGARILNAADEFTYEYRVVINQTSRNLVGRMVGKSPASDFTNPSLVRSGFMIRSGIVSTNDKFAAVLINPNGGCVFRYRSGTNTADIAYSGTTVESPWIRLERFGTNGTGFRAYYSTSTSSTPPTSWGTPFASVSITTIPTNQFFAGIAATNAGEPKLNRVEFASLSGF